jgi:hypothetical protein
MAEETEALLWTQKLKKEEEAEEYHKTRHY